MVGKCTASLVLLAALCIVHIKASSLMARQNGAADTPPASANVLQHIPSFSTVEELCEWLCVKASPHFDYGCPESCGGMTNPWSKRSAIRRRFDDFRSGYGFDDYLFMKLLGRNLGDRQ